MNLVEKGNPQDLKAITIDNLVDFRMIKNTYSLQV